MKDWNGFEEENRYNSRKLDHRENGDTPRLGMYHRLLRVLPPHIVDATNKHTKRDGVRDERLLSLVLGTGRVNEVDSGNQTSALLFAIIQREPSLIRRLCEHGAKTTKDEWQAIGKYVIGLVRDSNVEALRALIDLVKQHRDMIECDLTFADDHGRTAVMHSATIGNLEICELRVHCGLGADLLHVDQDEQTAADLAHQHGHKQVEDFLRNEFL